MILIFMIQNITPKSDYIIFIVKFPQENKPETHQTHKCVSQINPNVHIKITNS